VKDLQIPPNPIPEKPFLSDLLHDKKSKKIISKSEWKQQRAYIETRWQNFLGLDDLPTTKVPLTIQITFVDKIRSCSRYRLQYNLENRANFTTDAYLLVPDAILLKKMPAIIAFHQTTDTHAKEAAGLGAGSRPNMAYGLQLTELGYVVLCPRNFIYLPTQSGSKERREQWQQNVKEMRNWYPTWKGITHMVYDAMRAVDVLHSFAFVDPLSIGCFGHSLGAKQALYSAAFDQRFSATVFSEGGVGLQESRTNWDEEWYLGSTFEQINMDHHELLALIAPRPLLLLAGGMIDTAHHPLPPGIRKGADDEKSWKYIEATMPVYDLLGQPKNIGWWHHKLGHDYPTIAQEVAREFLTKHLPPP
jgi:dienelactone hydrolase